MPELPEVETTRRGIARHILGRTVTKVVIREPRLRWRVPRRLATRLRGARITDVSRRGKYLLFASGSGTMIVHLGMSGSLRVVPTGTPREKSDHVDIVLDNGDCLRLRDPRRFGCMLWTEADPARHRLLAGIGPDPLDARFDARYLNAISRGRRCAVRDLLLNGKLVSGVGNIYANEALFSAGIRPTRRAGRLSRDECARLAGSLRATLRRALAAGGTTLRDFRNARGDPGYFQLTLAVYGQAGKPCRRCSGTVGAKNLGSRRVFFCPNCQL